MYMTDQEANGKWCPHARVALADMDDPDNTIPYKEVPAFNRVTQGEKTSLIPAAACAGSKCAAWVKNPRNKNQGRCGYIV